MNYHKRALTDATRGRETAKAEGSAEVALSFVTSFPYHEPFWFCVKGNQSTVVLDKYIMGGSLRNLGPAGLMMYRMTAYDAPVEYEVVRPYDRYMSLEVWQVAS